MALTKVSTPAIKDEAITLAKLLHGDSNSNGKFLRANNGADPTFETITVPASINNLVEDSSPQLGGDLDLNSNNITGGGNLDLTDSGRIKLGTGDDLQIYHNGSGSFVDAYTNSLQIRNSATEVMAHFGLNGAVDIYHDGGKKFASHSNGLAVKNEAGGSSTSLYVIGSEGESAEIQMNADDGDDNADYFRLIHFASDNTWRLQNYAAGSWQTNILAISNGATELYNQGTKHFETMSNGVKIDSGGDTILEMHTSNGTAHSRINFSNNSGDSYGGIWYSAGNIMEFRANNAERMRITASGVLKSIGNASGYIASGNNYHELQVNSAHELTLRLRNIDSNGYGTMQEFPHSDSGIYGYRLYDYVNGNDRMFIRCDGDLENSNNSYGGISDIKLKENIVDAKSQWDDIKALKVRNFNYKSDENKTKMLGLVAQEAETVCPSLVKSQPDRGENNEDLGTETKVLKYSILYMKAIKALQEAQTRIETLETKVAALETA